MIFRRDTTAASGPTDCRAAPAGGASSRGRGCIIAWLVGASVPIAGPALAEAIDLPSGRSVTVLEYRADTDAEGPVLRARYLATDLKGAEDIDLILSDMTHLCEADALPRRAEMASEKDRIIVSLSSAPVELGEINADVTQYFEVYRVENSRCIWELF